LPGYLSEIWKVIAVAIAVKKVRLPDIFSYVFFDVWTTMSFQSSCALALRLLMSCESISIAMNSKELVQSFSERVLMLVTVFSLEHLAIAYRLLAVLQALL
jgi:hypothetical protein